jgi:hypothetical protein
MSQEHHHEPSSQAERGEDLNSLGRERLESLRHQPEQSGETAEERADAAREVIKNAEDKAEPEPEPAPKPSTAHHILKLDHRSNFDHTIRSVQRRLSPASRTFSRVIHAPAVERTSEVLEKTIARPSVLTGSAWTALLVGAIFYLTAYHFGYMLSGSELLFSFVVGALIGILLEGLWRSVVRH